MMQQYKNPYFIAYTFVGLHRDEEGDSFHFHFEMLKRIHIRHQFHLYYTPYINRDTKKHIISKHLSIVELKLKLNKTKHELIL